MLPTIEAGCTVTLHAQPFQALTVGDVIAFEQHSTLLVHRVVEVTKEGVLTAGDNNVLLDEPVRESDYLGCADLGRPHPAPTPAPTDCPQPTPLTVWLPHWTQSASDEWLSVLPSCTIRYFMHPTDVLRQVKTASTLGISPRGIWNEARLVRELRQGYTTDLVCFANFGPNKEPYFPGRACAGIARLNLPSAAMLDANVSATLTYLNQLLDDTRGKAHGRHRH